MLFEGFEGQMKKWLLIVVPIWLLVIGTIVYVAHHFIAKYW